MSEYWDDIETIAKEIREEYPDPIRDHNRRVERVSEDVDGSSWIIYYDQNETVLNETENEPDDSDVAAMAGPDRGWKDLRMIAAYLAMEGDVWQTLNELDKEAEESEEVEEGS